MKPFRKSLIWKRTPNFPVQNAPSLGAAEKKLGNAKGVNFPFKEEKTRIWE